MITHEFHKEIFEALIKNEILFKGRQKEKGFEDKLRKGYIFIGSDNYLFVNLFIVNARILKSTGIGIRGFYDDEIELRFELIHHPLNSKYNSILKDVRDSIEKLYEPFMTTFIDKITIDYWILKGSSVEEKIIDSKRYIGAVNQVLTQSKIGKSLIIPNFNTSLQKTITLLKKYGYKI